MNLYLKKQLRLGAIRFRVNPLPEGVRISVDDSQPSGSAAVEEYTLGSRRGLYYRKKYKGKRLNARQAQEGVRGILMGSFFLLFALMAASVVLWPHPLVPVLGLLVLGTLGGSLMIKDAHHCREMYQVKKELDEALIDPEAPPTEEEANRLYERSREMSFPVSLREDMYLAVLDRILDDRKITPEESGLLDTARYILSLSDLRVQDLHRELFSSAWLQLLEKGELTPDDLQWLEQLSHDLTIPAEDIEPELRVIREFSEAAGRSPESTVFTDSSESPSFLREGESIIATETVTRLSPKVTLEGNPWQGGKEETLYLTSERMVFGDEESSGIPLKMLDRIELDIDHNQLLLHREKHPMSVHLQTEHLFRLADLVNQTANAA